MAQMAQRLGEKAKRAGYSITVGPFNAHDRRIIHLTLKEDSSLNTESLGEGELKKIRIIPMKKEG
jgi:spoIIIJ-associated protein